MHSAAERAAALRKQLKEAEVQAQLKLEEECHQ
jgi:hypothetical protein